MTESRPQKAELFLAVGTGDLSKVKSLVDSDASLLAERDKGRGPIMAAFEFGNKDLVDFLATKALEALRNGLIPKCEIDRVIHDLGEGQVSKAKGDIAKFLRDEDPELRKEAVSALAFHLDSKLHRSEFERMLFEDPDDEVRAVASRGLAFVLRGTRDYRAARLLLRKLHDAGEDGYVRVATYEALQLIWLPGAEYRNEVLRRLAWPMSELRPLTLSWDEILQERINWAFVENVQREVEYVP